MRHANSTLANGFVADGYDRAYSAMEPIVRAEVTAEYADQIEGASFVGQIQLRLEIEREIKRRIHDKAPPGALY